MVHNTLAGFLFPLCEKSKTCKLQVPQKVFVESKLEITSNIDPVLCKEAGGLERVTE